MSTFSGSGLLAFTARTASGTGGAITDDGLGGTGLVKLGPAMLTLTDCSTYSFFGTTTISGGTLRLNDSTYQTITWGNVSNMATLVFNEPPLSVSDGALRQRLQRELSGSGRRITLGSGTMLLTGSNSYTGGTTISGGTLQIDDGTQNFGSGYSGSIVGNVVNKGTLAFSRIDNVTFPGNISGSGALVQLGDQGNQGGVGTLILAGSNTYSGGTTVSSGTLQIGNGGATGSITGNVTIDDSTYSGIYTSPPVLAFSRSDNVVFNGAITDINGTGTVVQVGPGKLTLTGSSNYGSNILSRMVATVAPKSAAARSRSATAGIPEVLPTTFTSEQWHAGLQPLGQRRFRGDDHG